MTGATPAIKGNIGGNEMENKDYEINRLRAQVKLRDERIAALEKLIYDEICKHCLATVDRDKIGKPWCKGCDIFAVLEVEP
jgi:hypothetical protein